MIEIMTIAFGLACVFTSGYGIRGILAKREVECAERRLGGLLDEWVNRANRNELELRKTNDFLSEEKTKSASLEHSLSRYRAQINDLMMKIPARDQAGRFVSKSS